MVVTHNCRTLSNRCNLVVVLKVCQTWKLSDVSSIVNRGSSLSFGMYHTNSTKLMLMVQLTFNDPSSNPATAILPLADSAHDRAQ